MHFGILNISASFYLYYLYYKIPNVNEHTGNLSCKYKIGAVQPGEEKAMWRPHSSLPIPEGGLQGCWGGTLH
uniref:Uncharacterized protein n=1 Tax=Amazona collaria TaxID=241587 RepID=A0A8B9FQ70_9PSIT